MAEGISIAPPGPVPGSEGWEYSDPELETSAGWLVSSTRGLAGMTASLNGLGVIAREA